MGKNSFENQCDLMVITINYIGSFKNSCKIINHIFILIELYSIIESFVFNRIYEKNKKGNRD